jgi:lipopolysaccharide transport system permease protein
VYFPRIVVPISMVLSNLITFAVQFLQFGVVTILYALAGTALQVNAWVAVLPILLVMLAGLGLGFGIIISSLTTRYRDLQYLVTFGTQLLMFATPVIYPLSSVPERYRWLVAANPLTPIVETFRFALLGAGTVSISHLVYSGIVTIVVLTCGMLTFNRIERTFMDTV